MIENETFGYPDYTPPVTGFGCRHFLNGVGIISATLTRRSAILFTNTAPAWALTVVLLLSPALLAQPRVVRIGAVAYSPSAVTIFEGIKQYLNKNGLPADYVLYSNYDALVGALDRGEIDIAWNTPLAHARYHVIHGKSQTLVMRDVDKDCRSVVVARADADVRSLTDLTGKTLILGSCNAAEATVLPLHYLKKEKVDLANVKTLDLDKERDFKGNPCSSPAHVLKALKDGRGDAGIISERLWQQIAAGPDAARFKLLWTSPAFSHCVFTAGPEFDRKLGQRFTALMLAMDPGDAATAETMRLEGTRQWIAGTPGGFADLIEAVGKGK